jgi:hypothetical protein
LQHDIELFAGIERAHAPLIRLCDRHAQLREVGNGFSVDPELRVPIEIERSVGRYYPELFATG